MIELVLYFVLLLRLDFEQVFYFHQKEILKIHFLIQFLFHILVLYCMNFDSFLQILRIGFTKLFAIKIIVKNKHLNLRINILNTLF